MNLIGVITYARCALFTLLALQCFSSSAQSIVLKDEASLQRRTLVFSEPTATTLGPGEAGSSECSDGAVFLITMDRSQPGVLAIYSIDNDGKIVSYRARPLPGYTEIGPPLALFASSDYVAEISDGARKLAHDISDPKATSPVKALIVVFKRDGTQLGGFEPPSGFEVKAIGVFSHTGDILAVGTKQDSGKSTVIRLYGVDGTELKGFRLWDDDPNWAKDLKQKQPWANSPSGALEIAQINAYGDNLMLVPTATSQPILILNETGVVRAIEVHLPHGLYLDSVLDSNTIPWTLKTFGQIQGDAISMHPGPLVTINPADGSLEGVLSWPDRKMRVFCEIDGVFLGLTVNEDQNVFDKSLAVFQR